MGLPAAELSARSKWLIAILVPLLLVGLTTFIFLSQGQGMNTATSWRRHKPPPIMPP